MKLQTPLARVRGLGSAKEGSHHWWMQRVSAVALIPLTFWFVFSIITMTRLDYIRVTDWMQSPICSALLILFIFFTFYHAVLGLRVVIEDYIENEALKITGIMITNFIFLFTGLTAIMAVLKIALGI